jgi:Flp pilus assembly protein TadD
MGRLTLPGNKMIAMIGVALLAAVAGPARPARAQDSAPGYLVVPFENRSPSKSMEWLRVAVPFMIGENLEGHPGMRAVYDELVLLPGSPPEAGDPAAIGNLAASRSASLVWTGSVERTAGWQLELTVQLWRVNGSSAVPVGKVAERGDFKQVHAMTNRALETLCKQAALPIPQNRREVVLRTPTRDHYAFTLFGRGLLWLHGLGDRANVGEGEKNLKRAVFIDPSFAEAHRLLGLAETWRKNWAQARGRYGYALDLRADYYAALAGEARALFEEGKVEPAQERFSRMLTLRPWDIGLRFQVGRLHWELGQVDQAHEELIRVVRERPDYVAARRTLVLVHASRGEADNLVSQLEALAELEPNDLETRLDLGAAYTAAGREDDAIALYSAILDKRPEHVQALKFTGDLYRKRGDLAAAIEAYKRALAANERDPRAYFLLGRAYVENRDDRAARSIYLRAKRFKKYLPETYNNLGSIEFRERHYGAAHWYFKRAVKWRPENPRFRYNFALVLSLLRQVEAALEQIDAGLSQSPRHVGLNYLRGVVALRIGDASAARRSFERTLEVDPDHQDARHNLALLDQMGRRATDGEVVIELPQPAQ